MSKEQQQGHQGEQHQSGITANNPVRKIYIVEMHTNGHKAALQAIQERGWDLVECQIIRCKSHEEVIAALGRGRSFAILPVANSIAGKVSEVLSHLSVAEARGYYFKELMRFDLPIEHFLAVPSHVTDMTGITKVYSHPQPFMQSARFLSDKFGIEPSEDTVGKGKFYEPCASTAEAADIVSRASSGDRVTCVTTHDAAEAFGLKILESHIQDSPDNSTTFVLLENEAKIESKTVGIIGIKGAVGKLFEKFFVSVGCKVIGTDASDADSISLEALVSMSDAIIISVPIPVAPQVAEEIQPWLRREQLLIDVTSIKGPVMDEMLKGVAEVVGLHPMFRPDMPFTGQVMVVCPCGLSDYVWKNWLVNVLAAMQVRVEWSTADEHDRLMSVVQVLVHLSNLVAALALTSTGASVQKSLSFASPIYKIALALIGRMVGQNASLYSAILIHNPYTIEIIEARIAAERRLLKIVKEKDQAAFEGLFAEANVLLGRAVLKYSEGLFARILSVVNILASPNAVLLECSLADSRPGLLVRILTFFAERGINCTGIDSLEIGSAENGGKLQFAVRLEQSRDSAEVVQAIREICDWKEVPITNVPIEGLGV